MWVPTNYDRIYNTVICCSSSFLPNVPKKIMTEYTMICLIPMTMNNDLYPLPDPDDWTMIYNLYILCLIPMTEQWSISSAWSRWLNSEQWSISSAWSRWLNNDLYPLPDPDDDGWDLVVSCLRVGDAVVPGGEHLPREGALVSLDNQERWSDTRFSSLKFRECAQVVGTIIVFHVRSDSHDTVTISWIHFTFKIFLFAVFKLYRSIFTEALNQ